MSISWDRTSKSAYGDWVLMGFMVGRLIAVRLISGLAAIGLLVIGWAGLVRPRRAIGLDGASPLTLASGQKTLASHLSEREITLDQRREAESLLMDFTRAQMTRHYWGEFADSLLALGLSSSDDVTTRVERDAVATKLWIVPRRGREAYLAFVERRSNQLFTQHCKGDRQGVGQPFSGNCPPSWSPLVIESKGS